jgi:hypothetical protein
MAGRGDRVSACIVKYHTVPRPLLPSIRFQPWARLFFRQQSVRKCPRMSETRSASQQLNAILLCDPEERRNYGRSHDSTVSRTGTFGVVVATLGVLLKSSCSHQLLVCPTADCVRKYVHTCSSQCFSNAGDGTGHRTSIRDLPQSKFAPMPFERKIQSEDGRIKDGSRKPHATQPAYCNVSDSK